MSAGLRAEGVSSLTGRLRSPVSICRSPCSSRTVSARASPRSLPRGTRARAHPPSSPRWETHTVSHGKPQEPLAFSPCQPEGSELPVKPFCTCAGRVGSPGTKQRWLLVRGCSPPWRLQGIKGQSHDMLPAGLVPEAAGINPTGLTVLLACGSGAVTFSPRGMVIHFRGQIPPADYFYKVLLEHKRTQAFMFLNGRGEQLRHRPNGLQSLNYAHSGPFQKS